MYDVVEIATGIVISEWHTEKDAQEQVDRFNKSANGEYYEVRKLENDNNEYKQKYEKLLSNIITVSCNRRIAVECFTCNQEHNIHVKDIFKARIIEDMFREIRKHIKCEEINTNGDVELRMKIKIYKDER